jgi:NDP-sugar pyrophosphorylase family protein
MNIVIPMAGNGSRFSNAGYSLPKPLIMLNGVPMIARAIDSLGIQGRYHFIVRNNEFLEDTLEAIHTICEHPIIIAIAEVSAGAAASALLFREYIDNDDELVIANCDQIMNWNSNAALSTFRKYDGAVVTIHSTDQKHSYVKLGADGVATVFAEKIVISDTALTGIHYWKHGKSFVRTASKMIADNDRASNGEFYIAPTYNYMIAENKSIGIYPVSDNEFYPVGTPNDLERYLNEVE